MAVATRFNCPHCKTVYTIAAGSKVTKCHFCGKDPRGVPKAAETAQPNGVPTMAKTKMPPKTSPSTNRKKKAKRSEGAVKVAGTGDDPNQTYMAGMETERSKVVDSAIALMEAAEDARKIAKEKVEQGREAIIRAFEKTGIRQYRSGATVYFLEDGGLMVKRRKAKEK